MTPMQDHLDKIEQALAFAYRIGLAGEVGPGWENRLMTSIRAVGPLSDYHLFLDLFQRHVWRLAPLAAILTLLAGVFLYHQTGFLTDVQLVGLLIENRLDEAIFEVLGRS